MEQGDVTCFVKQVHGIFQRCFISLLVVGLDPWHSIVEVGWEDGFGAIDHEKRRVTGCSAAGRPLAPEYRWELCDPPFAGFVKPVEDPRLEALEDHAVRALNLPVHVDVRYGSPINADVVVITESKEFLPRELCAVVGYDGVWDPESVDDVREEQHGLLGFDHGDRSSLYPLRELVHSDK